MGRYFQGSIGRQKINVTFGETLLSVGGVNFGILSQYHGNVTRPVQYKEGLIFAIFVSMLTACPYARFDVLEHSSTRRC